LPSLLDVIALRLDLEDALGTAVDTVMTDNMSERFYKWIEDDEVLIYEAK
jgi:predicted nucleotidyltransferase